MDKKTTFNVWYFVAAFAGILLLQSVISGYVGTKPIAYSEFQQLLRDNKRLTLQLRRAEAVIDIQKKVAALLGISIPTGETP